MAAVNLVTVTTINRIAFYAGQPGTSAGTLYTVPASTNGKITSILACNTSANIATWTLYLVAVGGSASASNQVFNAVSLAPGSTQLIDTPAYLGTGDFISGLQGTASAITLYISGETYA